MQKAGPCTARSSARPFCLDEDVNKSNINNMILIKTTQPLLMRWPSFTVWPSNGPATVLFFNNLSKDNTFCKNNKFYDHLLWRQWSRFDLVTLCWKNINFVAKYLLRFFSKVCILLYGQNIVFLTMLKRQHSYFKDTFSKLWSLLPSLPVPKLWSLFFVRFLLMLFVSWGVT